MLLVTTVAMCALMSCGARAQEHTVSGRYVGPTPGFTRKIAVRIESRPLLCGIVDVGPIDYEFSSPASGDGRSLVGAVRPTFGVEAERLQDGTRDYTVREIAQGPEPTMNNIGGAARYGPQREAIVHAVFGAAIKLGWLRSDGAVVDARDDDENADRMAAVQLLIWESVFESREAPERWNLNDGNFSASLGQTPGVARKVAQLAARARVLLDGKVRVDGLRTITNNRVQDRLVIARSRVRRTVWVEREGGTGFELELDSGSPQKPVVVGSPDPPGFVVPPPPPAPPPPGVVPLPSAFASGALGLALVALSSGRRRRAGW